MRSPHGACFQSPLATHLGAGQDGMCDGVLLRKLTEFSLRRSLVGGFSRPW